MANLFTDFPERIDVLKKYSDLSKLAMPLEEAFGDKETFKSAEEAMEFYLAANEELGKFAANDIQPTAAEIDRQGVRFENGKVIFPEIMRSHLRRASELGSFSGPISRDLGGLNIPNAVLNVGLEVLGHACPNTALNLAANSMADFIQRHGTKEQIEKYLPKLMSLEWETSMALTESSAGSDLGQLRTYAVEKNDHYLISGSKRFISNGQADLCFVLVRSDPNSSNLEGLSVMLVPLQIEGKEGPNFTVTKVEDKVCLHASATCEMIFENSVGYLFGEKGKGFKVMLDLMNQARLAMGAIAIGITMAALQSAKAYAKTRITMGKPIIQHPMVADLLYEMEIETRAMRALLVEASMAQDWMRIYEKKGDKKQHRRWKKRYIRLTPLVKYMTAENVCRFTRNALQIFGGYGVCRDYPVERFYREAVIYPIYEGTSQIQSLMVLKDTLKDVALNSTGFLGSLAGAWAESKIARHPVKSRLLEARNELNQAIKTILTSLIKGKFKNDIDALKEKKIQDFISDYSINLLTPKTDLTYPFLCAERLTRIVCDYYALKCMADHLPNGDKDWEKWTLEFAEIALPRMRMENHYLTHRIPSTLDYIKTQTEPQHVT